MAIPPPAFMRLLHQEAPDSRTPTQQSGHRRSRAQAITWRCSTPLLRQMTPGGRIYSSAAGEKKPSCSRKGSHASGWQGNQSCESLVSSGRWIISISSLLYLCSALRLSERSALFVLIQTHGMDRAITKKKNYSNKLKPSVIKPSTDAAA